MERKIHFRENLLIFLRIWGEAEFLRIWGAKEKKEFFFRDSGEINALFSGIKGAQTPLGASVLMVKVSYTQKASNSIN